MATVQDQKRKQGRPKSGREYEAVKLECDLVDMGRFIALERRCTLAEAMFQDSGIL